MKQADNPRSLRDPEILSVLLVRTGHPKCVNKAGISEQCVACQCTCLYVGWPNFREQRVTHQGDNKDL
jgi:hypothetical protein